MTEELSNKKGKEITRGIMTDFNSPDLPKLEEISWAFPAISRGLTRPKDGRLLNGQELNAWQSLLLFRNYDLSLKYSLKGKGVSPNNSPPIYQLIADPIDAFDTTHLEWNYSPKFLNQTKNPESLPESLRNISAELLKGYYWKNLPEGLAKMVNQTEKKMRGLNEQGEEVASPYYDENATTEYLSSVKDTLIIGAKYLDDIVKNSNKAREWPQMKSVKADELAKGDYIQIVSYGSNGPQVMDGVCSEIEPEEDKIKIKYSPEPSFGEDGITYHSEKPKEYPLSDLKENATMWKLIMPK